MSPHTVSWKEHNYPSVLFGLRWLKSKTLSFIINRFFINTRRLVRILSESFVIGDEVRDKFESKWSIATKTMMNGMKHLTLCRRTARKEKNSEHHAKAFKIFIYFLLRLVALIDQIIKDFIVILEQGKIYLFMYIFLY